MKKITAGRFEYLPARGEGYSHLHDTKTDTWLTAGASEFVELAKEILRHERQKEIYDFAHKEDWTPNSVYYRGADGCLDKPDDD